LLLPTTACSSPALPLFIVAILGRMMIEGWRQAPTATGGVDGARPDPTGTERAWTSGGPVRQHLLGVDRLVSAHKRENISKQAGIADGDRSDAREMHKGQVVAGVGPTTSVEQ